MGFLKYAFLFVMIRSMKERDPLKQVELKESAKSCKVLSSGVIFKSPDDNIIFVFV